MQWPIITVAPISIPDNRLCWILWPIITVSLTGIVVYILMTPTMLKINQNASKTDPYTGRDWM